MLGLSDAPGPLKPNAPYAPFPSSHVLPVDAHICLGCSCSLYGTLPGEFLQVSVEEFEPPMPLEPPRALAAGEGWRLDESLFKQRKGWADSKSFYDTDRVMARMFELDCEPRSIELHGAVSERVGVHSLGAEPWALSAVWTEDCD